MGILERIEDKLDQLLQGRKTESKAELPLTPVEATPEPVEATPAPVEPTEPVEVQEVLLDDGGYAWDERVHASTKTKTAKGIWTKRRGVSSELYNQVLAEQTVNPPEGSEEADINAIDAPTPPAPPAPKAPTPPAPPAPTPVDPKEEKKKEAMASIAELTTRYGVDYDVVLSKLPKGVKDFNSVSDDDMAECALTMSTWAQWLNLCHDERLAIQNMGGTVGEEGIVTICSNYDGATNMPQISPEHLPQVHESLEVYRKQWEAVQ